MRGNARWVLSVARRQASLKLMDFRPEKEAEDKSPRVGVRGLECLRLEVGGTKEVMSCE